MQIIKKLLLAIVILTISPELFGQDYLSKEFRKEFRSQQNEIFAYNILFNGFISGIGGVINKKKSEKFLPVLIKNFGKGCLGGFIKYSAKSQAYYLKNRQVTFLAPINRSIFFLGHSISMNASMNQRTLENLYFNLYGINFNYQLYETKGKKFNARLSLGTLASIIEFSTRGHKLDLYKSLEYGQFYFELNPSFTEEGELRNGQALYNVFAIRNIEQGTIIAPAQSSVPHEIVHTYQVYDCFVFSSLYKAKTDALLSKNKVYNIATKYVHFDYEPIYFITLYRLQPTPKYYKNFFEYEAGHFKSKTYILR